MLQVTSLAGHVMCVRPLSVMEGDIFNRLFRCVGRCSDSKIIKVTEMDGLPFLPKKRIQNEKRRRLWKKSSKLKHFIFEGGCQTEKMTDKNSQRS